MDVVEATVKLATILMRTAEHSVYIEHAATKFVELSGIDIAAVVREQQEGLLKQTMFNLRKATKGEAERELQRRLQRSAMERAELGLRVTLAEARYGVERSLQTKSATTTWHSLLRRVWGGYDEGCEQIVFDGDADGHVYSLAYFDARGFQLHIPDHLGGAWLRASGGAAQTVIRVRSGWQGVAVCMAASLRDEAAWRKLTTDVCVPTESFSYTRQNFSASTAFGCQVLSPPASCIVCLQAW